MSGKSSWTTWIIIIVLLVGFGLLAAVWPAISELLTVPTASETTSIPVETAPIELTIPENLATFPGFGGVDGEQEINPFVAIGVLTVVVIAVVGGGGAALSLIITIISRFMANTFEEESYSANQAKLEARVKEELAQVREGRTTDPIPSHEMPRWSRWSTGMLFVLFAIFVGYVINGTFIPSNEIIVGERILASSSIIIGILVLLTVVVLLIINNRSSATEVTTEEGETAVSIPWDFIAVLITGLFVVGLGVAAIVFLNPAG